MAVPSHRPVSAGGRLVPFGLATADGRLYAPREVPIGKDCGCICPACSELLVSKHCTNEKVTPHFAHYTATDCVGAYESALHLAAKQLIEQERHLFFPRLVAQVTAIDAKNVPQTLSQLLRPEGVQPLAEVYVEQQVGVIRPDLKVSCVSQGEVLVEILVTHAVSEEKLVKVRQLGMPMLEFDLSGISEPTFDALRQVLFQESYAAKWLYHPDRTAVEQAQYEQLQNRLANIEALVLREEAAAREEARKRAEAAREWDELVTEVYCHKEEENRSRQQAEAAQQAEITKKKAEARRQERNRAARFKAMSDEEKSYRLCHWLGTPRLPNSLHVRVPGAEVFGAAQSLLWQVALFGAITLRLTDEHEPKPGHVTMEWAIKWLSKRFTLLESFKEVVRSGRQERPKGEAAIWSYLWGLHERGCLNGFRLGAFRTRVATFAAYQNLTHFRARKISQGAELHWVAEDAWPRHHVASILAEAHAEPGAREGVSWGRLATLLPVVRGQEPLDIAERYGDPQLVLEYLISAGFLVYGRNPSIWKTKLVSY